MRRFFTNIVFYGTALLLLAACIIPATYDNYLARFNGYTEAELIELWGEPEAIEEMKMHRLLYFQSKVLVPIVITPAMYEKDANGEAQLIAPEEVQQLWQYCETQFLLEDGYVIKWQYKGAGCVVSQKKGAIGEQPAI